MKMSLVLDRWATNLNPTPKSFKTWKRLEATAVSGSAVTDTENYFNKDCPFAVSVIGFEVFSVTVSGDNFVGSGSQFTVALQRDTNVDASPTAPVTPTWPDTLVTIDCAGSGLVSSTDKMLFTAPSNAGDLLNVSLDDTYKEIPKGGSLRVTLSAQAQSSIGVSGSTPVELLAMVECIPTELKDRRYF